MNDSDQPNEFDWGGDGSNLRNPIAEHVYAALVPTDGNFPPPLDRLLKLGSPHDLADHEATLAAIDFTAEHIPALLRMARDRELNTREDDAPAIWAPIHALMALKRFDLGSQAAELIPLLDIDSDWFGEELAAIFGQAGAPVVEPLRQYLQDATRWHYGRWNAATALGEVGTQHPALRDQAIEILSGTMADERNSPETNGFLLSSLLNLEASEALPAIRAAFERDAIDESIAGSWPEVLEALGLPIDKADPLVAHSRARRQAGIVANRALLPNFGRGPAQSFPKATATKAAQPNKRKNKRKMAAASRKANKKKRR